MSTSGAGSTEAGRPRGRRPAGGDTRGDILAAARDEFAERGYDGASVRSVARRAEVDPALVRHYFRDKPELFAAAMTPLDVDRATLLATVTAGGVDRLGERLLTSLLDLWEADGGAAYRVLFAGLSSTEMQAEALLGAVGREVFDEITGLLPGAEPGLRVALVVSQVAGVLLARNVIHLEPIASLSIPAVVELVAPTLQHYLTGDL